MQAESGLPLIPPWAFGKKPVCFPKLQVLKPNRSGLGPYPVQPALAGKIQLGTGAEASLAGEETTSFTTGAWGISDYVSPRRGRPHSCPVGFSPAAGTTTPMASPRVIYLKCDLIFDVVWSQSDSRLGLNGTCQDCSGR